MLNGEGPGLNTVAMDLGTPFNTLVREPFDEG